MVLPTNIYLALETLSLREILSRLRVFAEGAQSDFVIA